MILPCCQPAFITFQNDKTAKFYGISLREIVRRQGWDIATRGEFYGAEVAR